MALNKKGQEVPSSERVAVPLRFQGRDTLRDRIKSMIARELSARAAEEGEESYEEADDFDLPEESLPLSKYELTMLEGSPDPTPPLQRGSGGAPEGAKPPQVKPKAKPKTQATTEESEEVDPEQ